MDYASSIRGWLPTGRRAIGVNQLFNKLETYLPPAQVDRVREAYEFGAAAHQGQKRLSGEPWPPPGARAPRRASAGAAVRRRPEPACNGSTGNRRRRARQAQRARQPREATLRASARRRGPLEAPNEGGGPGRQADDKCAG